MNTKKHPEVHKKKPHKKAHTVNSQDPNKEFQNVELDENGNPIIHNDVRPIGEFAGEPGEHNLTKDAQKHSPENSDTELGSTADLEAAPFTTDDPRIQRIVTKTTEDDVDVARNIPTETETQRDAGKVSGNRSASVDIPEGTDAFRTRKP